MNTLPGKVEQLLRAESLSENLPRLFCEILRWGAARGMTQRPLSVGAPVDATLTAHPVAQLSGLPVFRIDWPKDSLPGVTARRAVQRALKPVHAEHLICYVTQDKKQAAFVWARQRSDGKTELRTLPYEVGAPARTTIEQLAKLAFRLEELGPPGQLPINQVLAKLDDAFNVEAVTKQFYQEIANWYFWAKQHVVFPMPPGEKNPDAYISQSLIRLITRLIFCWFVKQMGLIPRELFDLQTLSALLKDGQHLPTSEKTIFYKAILQNLFFATLNQEIGKRGFRKRSRDPRSRDPHHGTTTLYRYENLFADPAAFLRLVQRIPFLNGGLFECLDQVYTRKEGRSTIRIDGFSDHPRNPLSVPDFLFFSPERSVDLSEAYGQAKYKHAKVRGLIHIFQSYNFTVTESTPLDKEVALDPELAGKVFENLLAAYNPETATTARKATGSYYTPREIVDYMVEEALAAYLKTKLDQAHPSPDNESRLRHLLAYHDQPHQFSAQEVKTLIAAIDNLKALDPACGSGAFPMGLLHKLVFLLGKLDPRNEQWKERQIARVQQAIQAAEKIEDPAIRQRTLKELHHQIASIEEAFARNELDYGRKLYLIENCIYGVDIQPIAVQIAKMRFFISLTIEQNVNPEAPNLGIRPLPNLETKFVAANTLIDIQRPVQGMLRTEQIKALEAQLRQIRQRHFTARTPAAKARCRRLDAKIRSQLSQLLQNGGLSPETTHLLAQWDPYDQNASAPFFDPEWMFGIPDGFDIVIGNPPYVRIQTLTQINAKQTAWLKEHYASARKGNYDLYVVFVERGLQLLNPCGQLAYILPHKFFNAQYGQPLRELLARGRHVRHVVHFGDQQIFPGATNYVCLLFLAKAGADTCRWMRADDLSAWLATLCATETVLPTARLTAAEWNVAVGPASRLFDKLHAMPVKLGEVADIFVGQQTSADRIYVLKGLAKPKAGLVKVQDREGTEWELEHASLKKFLLDVSLEPYAEPEASHWLVFPYEIVGKRAQLLSPRQMKSKFPRTWAYLEDKQSTLREREGGRFDSNEWYQFGRSQSLTLMDAPKLIVQVLAQSARFAFDRHSFYFTGGGNGPYYGLRWLAPDEPRSLHYLQALLNSRLLDFFLHKISTPFHGGYWSYGKKFIAQLPIRPINFGDASERAEHDALVGLVERILATKRADPAADTTALEREINDRVYRLYDLTTDEIKIVEEEGTK